MIKLVLSILFVGVFSCSTTKKTPPKEKSMEPKKEVAEDSEFKPKFIMGPPALVYKTKKDYNKQVAVNLNEDKSKISSYPHPKDVVTSDGFQTPTVLNSGYLLDNRGINENVAFLKITYEDYAKLKTVPSQQELYSWIIDKDPLITLCDCGNRKVHKDIVPKLNRLIEKNRLDIVCKTLK